MAQNIIERYNIPSDLLVLYGKKLNDFGNNERALVSAFKAEHQSGIASIAPMIEVASKNTSKSLYYFKPNKTKALFADYTRAQIKDTNCANQTNETEKFIDEFNKKFSLSSPVDYIKLFFTENAITKVLFSIVVVSLKTACTKACNENLSVFSLQTIVAIKAYKTQTGNYPNNLESLIPNYLTGLPLDPYNNLPLKYLEDKRIIYSVGPDGIDSGGSEGDDWTLMPDPTFKINF